LLETFTYPLLFEPGEAWEYGIGIDWAGFMVERVNGNISLQAYLEKNMYGLLGITTMTFHPKTNPACLNKLADTSDRAGGRTMFGTVTDPEAKLTHNPNGIWNMETQGCSAGVMISFLSSISLLPPDIQLQVMYSQDNQRDLFCSAYSQNIFQ